MKLVGKVALVTGGSRGIGFEVCRQLAVEGAHVILSARDYAKANQAAGALFEKGLNVEPFLLDVSNRESIAASTPDLSRKVDILINSAAVLDRRNFESLSAEEIGRIVDTNLLGPILLAHGLSRGMANRGWGRIVNVTSGMGSFARGLGSNSIAYRITKAALNAFTLCLATSLQGSGVLVNSVDPGWVRTDMGGAGAPRSAEQGASGIVQAVTLPDRGPTGSFLYDGEKREW